MQPKTILYALDRHASFVYQKVVWRDESQSAIEIVVRPRRLSWLETARLFGTSWKTVHESVRMAVCWGPRHRD